ncbi:MAG: type II secretion system secretin GspD [Halioglobus sp.]
MSDCINESTFTRDPPKKHLFRLLLIVYCLTQSGLTSAAEGNGVQIALEQAEIKDFIRWAANQSGKNIILHPSVKGKVTVLIGDSLTPAEAYGVFLSTLQVHGYAIVESENVLKVVPANQATAKYAPLVDRAENGYPEDVAIQVVRIEHLPPEQVVALVNPMLSPSSFVQAIADSNLVIIGDRRGNLERILALVEKIDKGEVTEILRIPIQFAAANEIVSQIRQLMPDILRREGENGLKVVVDQRTNAILLSGAPPLIRQVRAVIYDMDKPVISNSLTKVVLIDYLNANELVGPLMSVAQSLKDVDKTNSETGPKVSIDVNESNNALVITASEKVFAALQTVIHQLDVRRKQVLVEAIIVEVSAEKVLDYGINWRNAIPDDGGVFVGARTDSALTSVAPPAFGTGLTLGFYRSGELRGLIRALAGDSDTNFLSTPTLVTLDNHEAEILVGQNIPLITGSSTSSASSTDNPFQTIQRQDIGVGLRVTPRVNSDGSMTLEVNQTVESVAPTSVTQTDIVTTKREISTKVLIEDDEVLVLGGLIRDDLSQSVSKIPILGDIPVLGHLFRSSSDEVVKRNLMVFLHPRILHHRKDNTELTGYYKERIISAQEKFLRATDSHLFPRQSKANRIKIDPTVKFENSTPISNP